MFHLIFSNHSKTLFQTPLKKNMDLPTQLTFPFTSGEATRRVSKLVESTSMPGNTGFDNLQGRQNWRSNMADAVDLSFTWICLQVIVIV